MSIQHAGFAQVDGDHFALDVRRHSRQQIGQRGEYACADIKDVLMHSDFRLLHRPASAACRWQLQYDTDLLVFTLVTTP